MVQGRKCLSWEGGTRVYALVSGGLVPAARRGGRADQLMHIADWYPTFVTLAGVDPSDKWYVIVRSCPQMPARLGYTRALNDR